MTAVNKHTLWAIGVAWALTACSDDGDNPAALTPVPLQIQASILQQADTRVTADSEWETGDCIYIRGVKGGVAVDALSRYYTYQASTGSWSTSSDAYYFQDTQSVDLTAAHIPGNTSLCEGGSVLTNMPADDFLFANATVSYATKGVADLKFEHVMSQVVFKFAGVTEEEASGVNLTATNMPTVGSFNPQTGEAQVSSTTTVSGLKSGDPLIVYPQEEGDDVEVTFSLGDVDYEVALSKPTFKSGKIYTYTITVEEDSASESTTE
jgi:hypothetical protein